MVTKIARTRAGEMEIPLNQRSNPVASEEVTTSKFSEGSVSVAGSIARRNRRS